MRATHDVPFTGTPPDVGRGDQVEVRDAYGNWHRMTARGRPRYDQTTAFAGRCYLTVPVGPWGDLESVNWSAEDVRPVPR